MATSELPVQHIDSVLDELATPDLQWVQPPFGEEQFVLAAIDRGIKVAWFDRPWSFVDRPAPTPVLEVTRDDRPGRIAIDHLGDDLSLYAAAPGSEYAAVVAAGASEPSVRPGEGGDIDVACDAPGPGVLSSANALDGWRARSTEHRQRCRPMVSGWPSTSRPGPSTCNSAIDRVDAGVASALMFCGIASPLADRATALASAPPTRRTAHLTSESRWWSRQARGSEPLRCGLGRPRRSRPGRRRAGGRPPGNTDVDVSIR